MKGADGKIYDIDFFMVVQPGKLTVTKRPFTRSTANRFTTGNKRRRLEKSARFVNCRASVSAPNAFGVHRTEPRGPGDMDGQAGSQARREQASQTPYKTDVVAAALWAVRTRRTATRLQSCSGGL